MNITLNRLDPNLPDPVESRRRAAGRMVRFAYATIVFSVLGFFVIYFGAPLVFLGGPGTVNSPRHVVSLPFIVQVTRMDVAPGAAVKAGDEIGEVRSPEQDNIVATYKRALAELSGRIAELRVKGRVAQESLEAGRAYLRLTEEAVADVEKTAVGTMTYRLDLFRERALARKMVVSNEAEVAEAITQLSELDESRGQLRDSLGQVERSFAQGRVSAPIAGIIATNAARVGQSLIAGTPFAEILDSSDVFVDWHVPNARLFDPKVGNDVFVLFGTRRIKGKITEILPVSDVYAGTRQALVGDRHATQIARIRFGPDASPPALNSTVDVHMYYSEAARRLAGRLVSLLGLH